MEPRLQVSQKAEMATVNGHSVLGDDDVLEAIFNPEAPPGGKFISSILYELPYELARTGRVRLV